MSPHTSNERRVLLEGIYEFCRTGSQFEKLCRALLGAMGLGDVVVTGRPGDGSIDVVCTREGVEGLSAADRITYLPRPGQTMQTELVGVPSGSARPSWSVDPSPIGNLHNHRPIHRFGSGVPRAGPVPPRHPDRRRPVRRTVRPARPGRRVQAGLQSKPPGPTDRVGSGAPRPPGRGRSRQGPEQ